MSQPPHPSARAHRQPPRSSPAAQPSRRHRKLPWLLGPGTLMVLLLPVVLLAAAGNQCNPTGGATTPGLAGGPVPPGHGGWQETAYGPPWDAMNGSGQTAYGPDLTSAPPMLEIAIDPTVLTPRGYYHVWPNPFSSRGAFLAGDTGGAIIGQHIDTYDWKGRADQLAWGTRYGVSVTKAANPGAGNSTGQLQAPASAPTQIQGQCAQLAGVTVAPGQYVNPFKASSSIAPLRIDMGVDYSGTGPIVAMGNAIVTYSQPAGAGWGVAQCHAGYDAAVVYKLTDGPDRGRSVYVAEGIVPTVSTGQQIHAGQPVATFTGCIETGWSTGGGGDGTMAAALGQECSGDPGCHSTWCGENMSQLIHALGGPAGIPQGPIYGSGC